jgi:hypothetical protein
MVLLGAALAPALGAQVIRGVVTHNGEAMVDASVVLLDGDANIVRGTLTERDGSYTITCPGAGTFTLRVGGAGIEPWDSQPITVGDGETTDFDIPLGEAVGGPAAFERRRNSTEGLFLTEADILERTGNRFTYLFEHTGEVRVIPLSRVTGNASHSGFFTIRLVGANMGKEVGARQYMEPGDDCPPELFVNGTWWGPIDEASETGPDLALLPDKLVGVEVYTPTVVPEELSSRAEAEWCGVVVVWEKSR